MTLFGEGLAENSFETRLGLEAQIAERFTPGSAMAAAGVMTAILMTGSR